MSTFLNSSAIAVNESDVIQLTKEEANQLMKGALILVRSNHKNDTYGDHFSLIVGGKIKKERGVRPNLVTLPGHSVNSQLLNKYNPIDGAIILHVLSPRSDRILKAYGIHLSDGELINESKPNEPCNQ